MSFPTTSWLLWQNEHRRASSDPARFTQSPPLSPADGFRGMRLSPASGVEEQASLLLSPECGVLGNRNLPGKKYWPFRLKCADVSASLLMPLSFRHARTGKLSVFSVWMCEAMRPSVPSFSKRRRTAANGSRCWRASALHFLVHLVARGVDGFPLGDPRQQQRGLHLAQRLVPLRFLQLLPIQLEGFGIDAPARPAPAGAARRGSGSAGRRKPPAPENRACPPASPPACSWPPAAPRTGAARRATCAPLRAARPASR